MSDQRAVCVLGAGKIGASIARLLHSSGDYRVLLGDVSQQALDHVRSATPVDTVRVDVTDPSEVARALDGQHAVVSACAYDQSVPIAQAALETGVSYFDLTEDVAATRAVRALSQKAKPGQVFMPQCGLAPGFISILANHLCQGFERLDRIKMRVGALPLYPTNMLKYNLTWSTDGLINEYCNPCEGIRGGKKIDLQPLEGLEHFSLDGVNYEAFNTSGGLGTLCETLNGKVNDLDYKTVRYKGHQFLMMFLLQGLKFENRRGLLKEIMEDAVPHTTQDVVLAFCTVAGWRDGRFEQIADARKVYHGQIAGQPASSIQITTAASLCAVVDLHSQGRLAREGFVRQEDVSLNEFLENPFAKPYAAAQPVRTPIDVSD